MMAVVFEQVTRLTGPARFPQRGVYLIEEGASTEGNGGQQFPLSPGALAKSPRSGLQGAEMAAKSHGEQTLGSASGNG